jgi:hypothetical protein
MLDDDGDLYNRNIFFIHSINILILLLLLLFFEFFNIYTILQLMIEYYSIHVSPYMGTIRKYEKDTWSYSHLPIFFYSADTPWSGPPSPTPRPPVPQLLRPLAPQLLRPPAPQFPRCRRFARRAAASLGLARHRREPPPAGPDGRRLDSSLHRRLEGTLPAASKARAPSPGGHPDAAWRPCAPPLDGLGAAEPRSWRWCLKRPRVASSFTFCSICPQDCRTDELVPCRPWPSSVPT